MMARVLVPAFLDGNYPASTWMIHVPSMGEWTLAATHFVGMAGVGLDAAEYAPDDSTQAKKLGVFGYNRTTKLSDITDGPASTIAVTPATSHGTRRRMTCTCTAAGVVAAVVTARCGPSRSRAAARRSAGSIATRCRR